MRQIEVGKYSQYFMSSYNKLGKNISPVMRRKNESRTQAKNEKV